jgi:type 1 fimbriae regulatory protein FimE
MLERRKLTEHGKEVQTTRQPGGLPRRLRNQDYRPREYLSENEVERLISAALNEGHRRRQNKQGRQKGDHSLRNALMVMMAFRHSLRAGELVRLRWDDVDFREQTLHCRRLKNGIDGVHPLGSRELKLLGRLKKQQEPSRYIFMTERGSPITTSSFLKLVRRLGEECKFDMPLHSHMLRHSTAVTLLAKSVPIRNLQMYMGHKQIQNTTRYAQLTGQPFKNFWND